MVSPLRNNSDWTRFYETMGDALLRFRKDRSYLVDAISEIADRRSELPFAITDQFPDGSTGPLRDICPFTTMGIFNRSLRDANRREIASELARILNVMEPVPEFSTNDDGIPLLNNGNSWFFQYAKDRDDGAIDALWQIFSNAIAFADGDASVDTGSLVSAYDRAQAQPHVAFNLTMGLYWVRPWWYLPLDGNSRKYITQRLGILLPRTVPSGADYVALCDQLAEQFEDASFPVHSFPELSWAAYQQDLPTYASPIQIPQLPEPSSLSKPVPDSRSALPYDIDAILADGCFLDRAKLETMLNRLQTKQNIILQGPPGTGKTWLAKRLAYALIGYKDDSKVRPFQFHPNLSYEDFVRGWRPQGDGSLTLVDGPFLQMADEAREDPSSKYVIVIEEINRGNPASIFGEMLTLLESDKRTPDEALALAYPCEPGERFYIPPNVYVIGTMNVADRSLALVDLALRRRFAFFDLEPIFGNVWRNWVSEQSGIPTEFLDGVAQRMNALNDQIEADRNLGRQFRIGHSYFTPTLGVPIGDPAGWYRGAVESEIAPLLQEYWFDNPNTASDAVSQLLGGL